MMTSLPVSSSVSQAIQAINRAVDSGEVPKTLAALRSPGAGLYGVTPECAQNYQDDLAKIKQDKTQDGEEDGHRCIPNGTLFPTKSCAL